MIDLHMAIAVGLGMQCDALVRFLVIGPGFCRMNMVEILSEMYWLAILGMSTRFGARCITPHLADLRSSCLKKLSPPSRREMGVSLSRSKIQVPGRFVHLNWFEAHLIVKGKPELALVSSSVIRRRGLLISGFEKSCLRRLRKRFIGMACQGSMRCPVSVNSVMVTATLLHFRLRPQITFITACL